ncbi:MAG: signal recognition particle receptor subunit alpha [Microthrixaceae bacterium]
MSPQCSRAPRSARSHTRSFEEALILADVGIGPTQELLDSVRSTVKERKLTTNAELIDVPVQR